MNDFYVIATAFLALIFFAAGITTFIQPNESATTGLASIAGKRWFALMELLSSILLLLPLPLIADAVIAILLSSVVVLGQFLRIRSPDTECECFGSLTPRSPTLLGAISAIVLGTTIFIVVAAAKNPSLYVEFYWPLTVSTITIAFIIERKLRFDNLTGTGFASRFVDLSSISRLPGDLVLGSSGGKTYTAADAANFGKPILIFALSSHCKACKEIYARLITLGDQLASTIALFAVSHDDKLYTATSPVLAPLVSKSNSLSRFLGLKAKPYAIYLRPDLTLFAPPCEGSQSVIRLLAIIIEQLSESSSK